MIKALLLLDLLSEDDEEQIKPCKRIHWVRPWIVRKEQRGAYHLLVRELALGDETVYCNFFRTTKACTISDKIACLVGKRDALMRLSIKADERLAVTLRYLATGETFKLLQYCFRISRTTILYVVSECCDALFKILGPDFHKMPDSEEEWCAIDHFGGFSVSGNTWSLIGFSRQTWPNII